MDKPILFSTEMVKAIRAGSKTQTRRIIKFPKNCYSPDLSWIKSIHQDGCGNWVAWSDNSSDLSEFTKKAYPNGEGFKCPYGKIGDRLWVRETWAEVCNNDPGLFIYKSSYPECVPSDYENIPDISGVKWISPRFMPRSVSRITLEITNIRAEKLQNINETEAIAEGVSGGGSHPDFWVGAFADLWDSINAKRGYGWNTNPWVWVIEFRKII